MPHLIHWTLSCILAPKEFYPTTHDRCFKGLWLTDTDNLGPSIWAITLMMALIFLLVPHGSKLSWKREKEGTKLINQWLAQRQVLIYTNTTFWLSLLWQVSLLEASVTPSQNGNTCIAHLLRLRVRLLALRASVYKILHRWVTGPKWIRTDPLGFTGRSIWRTERSEGWQAV